VSSDHVGERVPEGDAEVEVTAGDVLNAAEPESDGVDTIAEEGAGADAPDAEVATDAPDATGAANGAADAVPPAFEVDVKDALVPMPPVGACRCRSGAGGAARGDPDISHRRRRLGPASYTSSRPIAREIRRYAM
jgi:hypothetical protein